MTQPQSQFEADPNLPPLIPQTTMEPPKTPPRINLHPNPVDIMQTRDVRCLQSTVASPDTNSLPSATTPPVLPCSSNSEQPPLLPQSTPIKNRISSNITYSSNQAAIEDTNDAMGKEMVNYVFGPVSAQKFLDDFFPTSELPDFKAVESIERGYYDSTISCDCETEAYSPFVSQFS
jgi:hypothetical protein